MAAHRHVVLALLLTAGVAVFADEAPKFDPKDSILVNCGADKEGLDVDGRKWVSDKDSKWLVDGGKTSAMATAESGHDPSLPSPVPYMSARVFTKETVYNFPVAETDRHWVRLHFYPSAYHGVPADNFYFTMSTSTGLTLLRNFSVYITAKALSQAYIVREFSLPPVDTGTLSLTFTPVAMNNGSYAFINGIEIISIPPIFDKPAKGAELGNEEDMTTSNLQTMYRLNVGGSFIAPAKDSGLSREWYDDTPYIFGSGIGVTFQANDTVNITYPDEAAEFVAPANVYRTSRTMGPDPKVNINYMLTWAFEVDANFTYLVRLHFCEMLDNKTNERVFDILINNQTAESAADVFQWASSTNTPVYKDYTVIIKPNAANDSSLLILQLKPNAKSQPTFIDAILNGLEIFKKSDAKNNLAGPNPDLSKMMVEAELGVSEFKPKTSNLTATLIGGAAGGAAAFGIVAAVCLVAYQNKKRKELGNSVSHSSGWLPVYGGNSHTNASKSSGGKSAAVLNPAITAMCRHFSFYEIKSATKNFDESLVIGVGGFGKVYRGVVDGDTKVAIKRSNPSSEQGVLEFQTEIEMLSKLRHKHLVSLIGCCEDNGEMILVYDYMAHGTFREHLYKSNKPPLSWKQRLELTIGAARGLHYLHTGAKYTIIHRDVKTTNILVDDKWVAKVSDFGLSKTGPTAVNQAHVSTMVKGSFGYLDPEYFRRQQLTEKSDVYSFGVVLFEVLCARPVLNPSLPREQVSLADHAMSCQRKGTLQDIIDPVVKGKIAPDCLKKFSETAEKCLADHGVDRPSMGDVLWNLEFALQMQETFENGGKLEGENSVGRSNSTSQSHAESTAANLAALSLICEDMDEEDIANSVVFSQLVHPTGR